MADGGEVLVGRGGVCYATSAVLWILPLLLAAPEGVVEVTLPRPPLGLLVLVEEAEAIGEALRAELDARLGSSRFLLRRMAPEAAETCAGSFACMGERWRSLAASPASGLIIAWVFADGADLARISSAFVVEDEVHVIDPRPRGLTASDVPAYVDELLVAIGRLSGLDLGLGARTVEVELAGLDTADRVELDGVPVLEATRPTRLQLRGLDPGRHRLVVVHPVRPDWAADFDAPAGARASLTRPPPPTFGRAPLLWSGIGAASVGVAVLTAALVRTSGVEPERCFGAASACPTTPRLARLGFDPDRASEPGDGPLFAPLGGALTLTGGTWIVGALTSGEDETPWVPLIVGLAAGALGYGIAEVIEAAR